MKTENPADVLAMIVDGGKLTAIADTTGWHKGEVVALAREHNYALNVSSDRFQPAPQSKPKPQGIVRPQTGSGAGVSLLPPGDAGDGQPAAAPEPPTRQTPVLRDVIAEGKAHSSVKVQRAAVKAEVAFATLVGLLDATRAEEAAKRKAEAEKAEARAEVDRLERQLAEAKAKLRGKPAAPKAATSEHKAAGKRPSIGVDYQDLDAWCRETGRPWRKQGMGRPTNALIEEFKAATAGAA